MTDVQWDGCTDPQAMLAFLREYGKVSGREARLFAVACCRRAWPLMADAASRQAVEAAERHADGLAGEQELTYARDVTGFGRRVDPAGSLAQPILARTAAEMAGYVTGSDPWQAAADVARTVAWVAGRVAADVAANTTPRDRLRGQEAGKVVERRVQAALLRDLAGPLLFRDVPLDPSLLRWNGGTVLQLARAAYEEREMPCGILEAARLAILADALEDAGCTDVAILEHLRGSGPHVRGCWAVDLLLGTE